MSIYRTTDPTQFASVDGIVVSESAPPPGVTGVGTGIALICGQFERGPTGLNSVGSLADIYNLYGAGAFSGLNALRNKKFSALKISRVVAPAAVAATRAFVATATPIVTFTALYTGAYGNNITVTVSAGSTSGKKFVVTDNNSGTILPPETYDNIDLTGYANAAAANAAAIFSGSKLVSANVNAVSANPDNIAATSLATGSDGTVADVDYQTALAFAAVEASANVVFFDAYNSTRNGYLKTHAAATQDKMVIVCGANGDTVSTAVTDTANYRDVDGRIIYGYPYVNTTINGATVAQAPASWIASCLSQTAPNIDPAFAKNAQYFAGITSLVNGTMTRTDYISCKNAGICAFENDVDLGIKLRSGIVTQISDNSKISIARRRMADYLTYSAAKFLKNYQNAPNTLANRTAVKGAILGFVTQLEQLGMLPSDAEVATFAPGSKAKLVDTDSLNTAQNIAQGYMYVIWKQRTYSSMRFIVLQAQIGESVVVTAA